jgi:hypothetical protein
LSSGASNLDWEKNSLPAWEEPPTHVPIHDDNEEEEEWYMNVEGDDIYDAIDLNLDENWG